MVIVMGSLDLPIFSHCVFCLVHNDFEAVLSAGILQCFDTVGWVVGPLKTVPEKMCRAGR